MNKGAVIGIIIAVAVVIGIAAFAGTADFSQMGIGETAEPEGKQFTVLLQDGVGIKQDP